MEHLLGALIGALSGVLIGALIGSTHWEAIEHLLEQREIITHTQIWPCSTNSSQALMKYSIYMHFFNSLLAARERISLTPKFSPIQ